MLEKIPVENSIGNQNRHTFWCDAHEQRRFYGVCLNVLDAYEGKRIVAEDEPGDCANAMCRGRCNAMMMRKEEIDKGEAIYFVQKADMPEIKKVDRNSESYKIGWNKVPGSNAESMPVERKYAAPTVSKKPALIAGDPDYSTLISDMASDEVQKGSTMIDKMKRLKMLKAKRAGA